MMEKWSEQTCSHLKNESGLVWLHILFWRLSGERIYRKQQEQRHLTNLHVINLDLINI